jgi:hypothetical protein
MENTWAEQTREKQSDKIEHSLGYRKNTGDEEYDSVVN